MQLGLEATIMIEVIACSTEYRVHTADQEHLQNYTACVQIRSIWAPWEEIYNRNAYNTTIYVHSFGQMLDRASANMKHFITLIATQKIRQKFYVEAMVRHSGTLF